ncbi:MAG: prepilin-type N-terminal cleavage/methylation domain-containing protein [Candidatus Levyibacteriota bacterium]|nr:MAG: prepilin-type N-terminal cleavage/methylation domain-containing protein [Candidatus Levybacteria bacterium]
MKDKGFTLIELLVVMVVLIAVGAIIGAILFSSLRGANKTNAITLVRQNGNYAISQMAKTIRNAEGFYGVSNNGTDFISVCPAEPETYNYVRLTAYDKKTYTTFAFSCASSPPTIYTNGISFLDSAVTLACDDPSNLPAFTCMQASATDAPVIGINFALTTRSGLLLENAAKVPFQTTVTMRNAPR